MAALSSCPASTAATSADAPASRALRTSWRSASNRWIRRAGSSRAGSIRSPRRKSGASAPRSPPGSAATAAASARSGPSAPPAEQRDRPPGGAAEAGQAHAAGAVGHELARQDQVAAGAVALGGPARAQGPRARRRVGLDQIHPPPRPLGLVQGGVAARVGLDGGDQRLELERGVVAPGGRAAGGLGARRGEQGRAGAIRC